MERCVNQTEIADRLSALSHPARLGILMHLSKYDACACRDVVSMLPLAQSTVSQHLKVLLEAGLITHERDAQRSRYRLNRDALRAVSQQLNTIVDSCCSADCCGIDGN